MARFALGAGFAAVVFAAARFGAGLAAAVFGAALAVGFGADFAGAALAAAAFGAAFAFGRAAAFGLALALAAALGFGSAVARRFGLSSAGVGLRAMAASYLSVCRGCKAAALIAVAEAACSRAEMKHHLAFLVACLAPASNAPGRQRPRRSTEAAAPCSARLVQPGRGSTDNGVEVAMRRHDFQRGSCTRLSAPIRNTKTARGKRRRSFASVSAVKRVPSALSISDAITRLPSEMPCALAKRSGSGAMPARGFSGLPGETMSQT